MRSNRLSCAAVRRAGGAYKFITVKFTVNRAEDLSCFSFSPAIPRARRKISLFIKIYEIKGQKMKWNLI